MPSSSSRQPLSRASWGDDTPLVRVGLLIDAPVSRPTVTTGQRPGRKAYPKTLSDAHVLCMVVAVWATSWGISRLATYHQDPNGTWPVKGWFIVGAAAGVATLCAGWRWGKPRLVVFAVVVLSVLAAINAEVRYEPVVAGPYHAEVALITDPAPQGDAVTAIVALGDGSRVEARAFGGEGARLADLVAGDRVEVEGTLRPLDPASWRKARHLEGDLSVATVGLVRAPARWRQGVEIIRRSITSGARGLPEHHRPLYAGIVVGDDRFQPLAQQVRFRAAGLTHLLAVSGQNVAFVLAVLAPVLRSIPPRRRIFAVVAVLFGFAVITRMEPSVIRATVTTGIAALAALQGHRQHGLRVLGLGVCGLVVIDPFLVHSIGFQLSVAASAAILALGGPLTTVFRRRCLPAFCPVADALGITTAAQLGVLPLQLAYFGPMSFVSLPANVAAGWAAGAVMTLGLTVGVLAGFLPEPLAQVAQIPTTGLLWWLDTVASAAPRWPTPEIDLVVLAAAAGALAGRMVIRPRWLVWVLVLLALAMSVPHTPRTPQLLGTDRNGEASAVWVPTGSAGEVSVVVLRASAGPAVLDQMLRWRIRSPDLIITESYRGSSRELVDAAITLTRPRLALGPSGEEPPSEPSDSLVMVEHDVIVETGFGEIRVMVQANSLEIVIDGLSGGEFSP